MIVLAPSQGHSQDLSKGGVTETTQQGHHLGIADYIIMVYTAALPHVSAGSVVLSWHEGPY